MRTNIHLLGVCDKKNINVIKLFIMAITLNTINFKLKTKKTNKQKSMLIKNLKLNE